MGNRFANEVTEEIYRGKRTKQARNKCPTEIWDTTRRKLNNLISADSLEDVKRLPGNRYKKLKGNRKGRSSIRINNQYRITFLWDEQKGAYDINVTDYH